MARILGREVYAYAEGNKIIQIGFHPLPGRPTSVELEREIGEYLRGERTAFSFFPDFSVYPPTVRRILEYIYHNLPYGNTLTYSQVAEAMGTHPRVVGLAMAKNRHLIVVPCHRVVGKYSLGGFSGGLEVKRFLLSLEGRTPTGY